ncbi:MAG: LTA synthase family protein [Clostridia bacterium]|nr:LTA synthase family protein [Clostridia bacterium]
MSRFRAIFGTVVAGIRELPRIFYKMPVRITVISALILNIIIEILCRHSFVEGFKFIFQHPFMFLVGWMIILFTFCLSWIIPKGIMLWLSFLMLWLGFAIANSVVLIYRAAPLTGSDFAILGDVLPIIGVYLNVIQIILISLAILGVVGGLIYLWIKVPSEKGYWRRGLAKFLVFTVLIAVITPIFAVTGVLPRDFSDVNGAYKDYGFPYGFICSIFVQGISEPENYSQEEIKEILDRVDEEKQKAPIKEKTERPNVVYVQLESFFDINAVKWLTLNENPLPNFTALKEKYPSGYLQVPLVGAGTANTEFEILTGMNLDYFGAGEYPYNTVLDEQTCQSVAYVYSDKGYKTHAMHNNTGTFYLRNVVYANLGFDTFTPIENMYDVEYNELDWAKDSCLFPQIRDTLLSTPERDFVFTVSVQAHGKYPEEMVGTDYPIGAEDIGGIEDEALKNMYLYYINQLKGSDDFIGELVQWAESFDEPTVILFYGDHLPFLELEDEDVVNGDLHQTEYILYSNYELGENDLGGENYEAYQINSFVFGALGTDGGIMSGVHTYLSGQEDYIDILKILEYDMLFGEKYAYGERGVYPRKDMQFGIRQVLMTDLGYIRTGEFGEKYIITVKGFNFNEYSRIQVNGKTENGTQYISSSELKVILHGLKDGDKISVVQEADNGTVFFRTEEFTIE